MDHFEIQTFENEEESVHMALAHCGKNPGHSDFIPVDSFELEHLPSGHRDPNVYQLIGLVARLTVKVKSVACSKFREILFPGRQVVSGNILTGSGRVYYVTKYVKGFDDNVKHPSGYTSCHCRRCLGTASPSDTWWEIAVITAAHVVCDYTEVEKTECCFFYDNEESEVKTVDTVSILHVNAEEDKCILNCITCDDDLGNTVNQSVDDILPHWNRLHTQYKESNALKDFSFMVSHPHGGCKRVTLGKCLEKVQLPECAFGCYFSYTTPTCPGSSGAIVYLLGYSGTAGWSTLPVHSRTLGGVNISGASYVR
ncbi:hypothetical protein BgiMline_021337 [Biomphalaria glabrata]|uniref:Uncharacterized protein LOC129928102 n=1 Tax=Biomphalaria glabrata TaxID=6526 RepID=A0A9W3BAV3_BIOGL|nr:uncharacterized protein LOC129928102 [Biomphalaria glabrata]KAI8729282.1 hypothetical protein BgiMline_031981 [Biomphalaria glabrata]